MVCPGASVHKFSIGTHFNLLSGLMILKFIIFRAISYYSKKSGINAVNTVKNLRKAFPKSSFGDSTIYRYYSEINEVTDIVPSYFEVEDKTDKDLLQKLKIALEEKEYVSTRLLADEFHISNATVSRYISKLHFKYKRFEMIPHELTDKLRSLRIRHALVMKTVLDVLEKINFLPLITTDETWLLFRYQPTGCYTPAGTPSPTKVRIGRNEQKQMYVPLLTANGIIFDWYLPANASMDSTLWINHIVKTADEWWQNEWESLPLQRKMEVQNCVEEALQAARRVITEQDIPLVSPLAGVIELPPAEQIFLSFRVSSKPASSSSTTSSSSSSSSSSSLSQPEESEEESLTDTPIDEVHHSEIISHPERLSAIQFKEDVEKFPKSYLLETPDDDEEFRPSSYHSKKKPQKQSITHIQSAEPLTKTIPGCFFHFDNAPAHNSFSSRAALQRTQLIRLPQPPYSPDLAICDFSYFGQLKTALSHSGIHATNLAQLKSSIAEFNKTVNPSLLSLFKTWKKRLEYISTHNGDYYPSILHPIESQQEESIESFPGTGNSSSLLRLEETRGIVGLQNEDSQFCYLNSVTQCLLATAPLISFFLRKADLFQSLPTLQLTPLCLLLFEVVKQAWSLDPIKLPSPHTTVKLSTLPEQVPVPVLSVCSIYERVKSLLPDLTHSQQDVSETFEQMWKQLV